MEGKSFLDLDKDTARLLVEQMDAESAFRLFNSSMRVRRFFLRNGFLEILLGRYAQMDGATLSLLSQHLAPFEIILFCSQSSAFKSLCNRNKFWSSVLRYHYNIDNDNDSEARKIYFSKTPFCYTIRLDVYNENQSEQTDGLGNKFTITDDLKSDIALITVPLNPLTLPEKNNLVHSVEGDELFTITIPYEKIGNIKNNKVWIGLYLNRQQRYENDRFIIAATKDELVMKFVDDFFEDNYDIILMFERLFEKETNFTNQPWYNTTFIDYQTFKTIEYSPMIYSYSASSKQLIYINSFGLEALSKLGYPLFPYNKSMEDWKDVLFNYIMENNFYSYNGADQPRADLGTLFLVREITLQNSNSPYYDLPEQ